MMHRLRVAGLVAGLTACDALGLDGEGTTARAELIRQRTRWERADRSTYTFTYTKHCFCLGPRPTTIDVENDAVVAARYQDGAMESISGTALNGLPTIDSLFAIVGRALNDRVDGLRVDYDLAYGFPEFISVDPRALVADDEHAHRVSELAFAGSVKRSPGK